MCKNKNESLEEKLYNEGIKEIISFFQEEELKKIKSYNKIDNYSHPLKSIIIYDESRLSSNLVNDRESILYKTNRAFEIVSRVDSDWLNAKKTELLGDDYSVASSVLGEIRVYAEININLFNSNFNDKIKLMSVPTQKNTATPDFRLNDVDYSGMKYIVDFEVFTKTPDRESQKGIDLGTSISKMKDSNHQITTRISSHRPFSTENREANIKKHASDLRHLIHLFTQIKAGDKQFTDEHINVLWIDMQDETMYSYGSFLSFASPTTIREAAFLSSTLWHAFYGKKGMIILHEMFQGEHNTYRTAMLEHDGRFYLPNNKADFVIFSFPRKTIVFEKPDNNKVIPERFRESLTYLLHFNSVESRIDFPKGSLELAISNDVDNLNILYRYLSVRDEWEEQPSN